jgi:hypothetical protein
LELRQKTNEELFRLYEGELTFHHRSAKEAADRMKKRNMDSG